MQVMPSTSLHKVPLSSSTYIYTHIFKHTQFHTHTHTHTQDARTYTRTHMDTCPSRGRGGLGRALSRSRTLRALSGVKCPSRTPPAVARSLSLALAPVLPLRLVLPARVCERVCLCVSLCIGVCVCLRERVYLDAELVVERAEMLNTALALTQLLSPLRVPKQVLTILLLLLHHTLPHQPFQHICICVYRCISTFMCACE